MYIAVCVSELWTYHMMRVEPIGIEVLLSMDWRPTSAAHCSSTLYAFARRAEPITPED